MANNQQIPTSQRAIQWTTPPQLTYAQTAPVPGPASGDKILVRVLYSTINPIDHKLAILPFGMGRLALGAHATPGTDFVGHVASSNNSQFKGGDLVFGNIGGPGKGTLADYTLCSAKTMTTVPSNFPKERLPELGCAGVAGLTALQILKDSSLPFAKTKGAEKGGSVFINGGSGGVGSVAVQIAKHVFGCERVVASCSGGNADLVRNLGADHIIDYKKGPVVQQLIEYAREHGPFDHIADAVGNDFDIYYQAHKYTTPKAKFVEIGGQFNVGFFATMLTAMALPAFLGGGKRSFSFLGMIPNKQDLDDLALWMTEKKIKITIEDGNVFNIRETSKAFEQLNTGRTRGKISIQVNEE